MRPVKPETKKAIEEAVNCNSEENGSDTPDFILADFLGGCLDAWNDAVTKREAWYGRACGDGAAILRPDDGPLSPAPQPAPDLVGADMAEAPSTQVTWIQPTPALHEMLVEQLAAYAHEAWSGWMRYLFSKTEALGGVAGYSAPAVAIPSAFMERWQRQASTAYVDLPEEEKGSDRKEAELILNIILPRLGGEQ